MTVINNNISQIIALNDIKNMEKGNNSAVVGVYHSRDLDGYTSGAIIKLKYPNAKLIGFDYGQELVIEEKGIPIIMADVSMPITDLQKLSEQSNNQFTILDHHKSFIEGYINKFCASEGSYAYQKNGEAGVYNYGGINAVLKIGISASEICWKYFFPDKPMPRAILLLGIYDTWRNEDKELWENEILPFQFGMRMICNSPETFPTYLFSSEEFIDNIIENGKTILKYQSQVNEAACKGAFEYEFEGLRCICLNGGGFNSDVFKSVYDESKHDAMMPFKYDGKNNQWVFSLYGTKDIDLSLIAKKLGGGGHKSACGWQCASLSDVFKDKDI